MSALTEMIENDQENFEKHQHASFECMVICRIYEVLIELSKKIDYLHGQIK